MNETIMNINNDMNFISLEMYLLFTENVAKYPHHWDCAQKHRDSLRKKKETFYRKTGKFFCLQTILASRTVES